MIFTPEPESFVQNASELILFGSRAVDLHTPSSDWDVLYVGPPQEWVRNLDQIRVTRERLLSREWLGSELAGHIAQFGRVICGSADWREKTFRSRAAMRRKQKQIEERAYRFEAIAARLNQTFERKLARKIRRDIQRLKILEYGLAIPPTPALDLAWRLEGDPEGRMMRSLDELRLVLPQVRASLRRGAGN